MYIRKNVLHNVIHIHITALHLYNVKHAAK